MSKSFTPIQQEHNFTLIQQMPRVNKTQNIDIKDLDHQKGVASAMIVSVPEQVPGGNRDI